MRRCPIHHPRLSLPHYDQRLAREMVGNLIAETVAVTSTGLPRVKPLMVSLSNHVAMTAGKD